MTRSLVQLTASKRRLRLMLALPAAAASAVVMAACGSSNTASGGSSSSPVAAASTVTTANIGGATVLTNDKGFTLYSFAPDTSTSSNCNGSCATNWPPEKGPVTAAGVKGTFATIQRSDGSTQASFNGHPLYTFVGDTSAGQANGNGVNAFGGVWQEVTTSGSAAPANGPTSGSGGGSLRY
jgi:predicted lipoprotein with Yx(FWY)xxD motif